MRKNSTFILVGILCTSCWLSLPNSVLAQYTQTNKSIATGPNSGGFIEMLPPNYSKNTSTKYPLMIFLEGEGQMGSGSAADLPLLLAAGPPQINAAGQWPDSFVVNKKAYSFVIICPQFKAWPNNADIDSVVQYALKTYRVDTGRVYMTGTSMGGNCIWSYCSIPANAQMLAAIMPVASGEMWTGMQGATSIAQADLPVYATTNVYDPNEADTLTLNDIAEINSVVPQIRPIALDTVYADSGHDAWTKTYYTGTYLYHGLNCYQWMLQYSRDPGDTLPTSPPPAPTVTISSFTATLASNNTEVAVAWTTSVERGNKYFIVQRSTDDVNFTSLDTTASTAAQGGGASYRYTDPAPPAGNDYYRLVSVDTTGNSTFYSIVEVAVPAPATAPPPLVTLSAYTATLMPTNEVSVAWSTSVERGNSYFVVQRSTDSVTFSNLYSAASTAAQGGGASYEFTDATPPYGNDYYRLLSVDTAGAITYFAALKVNVPAPPLVQLSAYAATVTDSGKEVTVAWTTSLERQNQYFLVERSTDSANFTNLAAISSMAPYGGGASYSYTDISPVAGNDYYRLVSVDSAGADSVFPVLSVDVPAPSSTVSAVGPVALTAYTATITDNGQAVNILWTTASELGNKDFIVERSTDSIDFTDLDTVAATGTATSGASYSYTDNAPAPGYNYYRLQRFDVDGDDTLYRILRVQAAGKWVSLPVPSLALSVSPNPATGLVYLQLVDSIQGTLQVSLTDMAGRVLQVSEFQKVGPVWNQTIDVSMLPRGVYVLQVRGMTTRVVQTILKE